MVSTISSILSCTPVLLLALVVHASVAFVAGPSPYHTRRNSIVIKTTNKTKANIQTGALYLAIDATTTANKDELLSLVQNVPSGRPTSRRMTQQILDIVQALEYKCPTADDDILARLAGSWELLWTAQDPAAPETTQLGSWINPLENQSYSNNPEGRSNPFLPVELQNRLEKAGWVSSTAPDVRSTQAIDLKAGLIRNIVALNLGNGQSSSRRRASLTVTVKFSPVLADPRRVNVKFQACKVSLPSPNNNLLLGVLPSSFTIPLGIAGPTGWLRTVYIDDDLRVSRGHKGSVFVLSRPRRASV